MRIGNEYLWGVLLIVAGVLFLLRNFLNINIPIFRTIVALLFIYVGVSIFFGGFQIRSENLALFRTHNVEVTEPASNQLEYNIIFSKGNINLTDISLKDEGVIEVEINAVFSDGLIRINPEIPTVIEVSSAFASTSTPDKTRLSFGDHTYKTSGFDISEPHVKIEANSVFSSLNIVEER